MKIPKENVPRTHILCKSLIPSFKFFFFIFDPADRKDVLSDRNVFFLNTDIVLKQGLIVFCWW